MSAMDDQLTELSAEFELLGDWEERYRYVIDLGRDLSKGCFMAMIVRNGRWERLAPAGGGYLC